MLIYFIFLYFIGVGGLLARISVTVYCRIVNEDTDLFKSNSDIAGLCYVLDSW